MPAGFQHIPVPLFRKYEVMLAELCALQLWQGINYENGKQMDCSDEELMQMFATPVDAIYSNPNTNLTISEADIRSLIKVARLKALFRSANPTDFQAGIAALKSDVMPIYSGWRNQTLALSATGYATKAIVDWSKAFVQNTSGPSTNGNYRVALACRILFFATPDMKVFNFSNGLAKVMRFQSRPQAALPDFNSVLDDGLRTNAIHFATLSMPKPITLKDEIWKRAEANGWWQRRVLDLALLLHFNVVIATPQLRAQAMLNATTP